MPRAETAKAGFGWPYHCFHVARCGKNKKCWLGLADGVCIHARQDIAEEVTSWMEERDARKP